MQNTESVRLDDMKSCSVATIILVLARHFVPEEILEAQPSRQAVAVARQGFVPDSVAFQLEQRHLLSSSGRI